MGMRNRGLAIAGGLAAVVLLSSGCGLVGGSDGDVSVDSDGVSIDADGAEVSVEADGVTVTDEEGGDGVSVSSDGVTVTGDDDSLNITVVADSYTEDCEGRDVNVGASGAEVILHGDCGDVQVAGSDLTVHVGSAAHINVTGANNTVYYASGSPETTDIGTGNQIAQGGDAQS